MADLTQRIEAHALANALKYGGKANPGNVLPKIIGEFPDVKKDIQGIRKQIDEIVATVNALGVDAQRAKLESLAPELLEKKEHKERELPPLPNAIDGKVITRIPPEPSKYNHLGHALTFLMNAVYADRYHGQVIIRFEDANPEKVSQAFVDTMMEDITGYLGIKPSKIHFVSDDMEELYRYARKLVETGNGYMCFCDRETMSKYREEERDCACRHQPFEHHLKEWDLFVGGAYVKGEAILRFKGDMKSQNTVLRDPVMYRFVGAPHFRHGTKYKVWPTYDFYSAIEEAMCGVTHILRSNEFELRVELQTRIKRIFGLPEQDVLQYGRFNVAGATTQGREIREAIESGNYLGWDDPRLVTLKALKRRGIRREAYIELLKQIGLSPYPVSLDFSMLAAANRKFIEDSPRFSFVENPVHITVVGAEARTVEQDLHPSKHKGGRVLNVADQYLISAADVPVIAGKRVRLMGNLTFAANSGDGGTADSYALVRYDSVKDGHDIAINWVPADASQTVMVAIMMADATVKTGVAEKTVAGVRVDDIVQFERFGFCRLDAIEQTDKGLLYTFWFTHK